MVVVSAEPFLPRFLPTGIGSLPHTDAREAVEFVWRHCPEIPWWPQLPRRAFAENFYAMFSEHLPGRVLDEKGLRLWVDSAAPNLYAEAEKVLERALSGRVGELAIGPAYASGLYEFGATLTAAGGAAARPLALKGQITGPISFGLQVADERRRPILYDPLLADVATQNLAAKLAWQRDFLAEAADAAEVPKAAEEAGSTSSPLLLMFVDEPILQYFGSALVSLSKEDMLARTGAVLEAVRRPGTLTGLHCCANTDWGVVLDLPLDILSFDAFGYGESILLYPEAVARFLGRGGVLAWGIVPAEEDPLEQQTAASLEEWWLSLAGQLVERIRPYLSPTWAESRGEHRSDFRDGSAGGSARGVLARLAQQSLLTPSCGLGTQEVPTAEKAFTMLRELSNRLRRRLETGAA